MSDRHPLFSVLTPVYNTPAHCLRDTIESVLGQTFPDFELLLVDDASTEPHIEVILREAAVADPRVQVVRRATNGGIALASADALADAHGTFVALLDHDDVLTPDALQVMASAIRQHPDADLLYSDEDKVDEHSTRYWDPFFKPDWSPARLRSQQYIGHLAVLRTSVVTAVGGFREGFDGSQDYDLVLRVTESARQIVHVPRILYHWRSLPASVASAPEAKPYAFEAARRALAEHCARVGIDATVEQTHGSGIYRIRPRFESPPLISIVIPTRGSSAIIRGHFRTLVTGSAAAIAQKTTYPNYEVVVVADRSMPASTEKELTNLFGDRLKVCWFDRPFNFSEKVNAGALAASGEYLLFLNDDTEVVTPDWIEALLAPFADPGVGMTGSMLYFEDGTIQHAGHFYQGGNPNHIGLNEPGSKPGPNGAYLVEREVTGVTAACALVPTQLFHQVGGFTMQLPANFNDVDFSMKIRSSGRRIIWTPHCKLFHFESKTREARVNADEVHFMHHRWRQRMMRDPFWPSANVVTHGLRARIRAAVRRLVRQR